MPNAIFHAGARGVDRQPIFLTDHDRRFFIDAMNAALAEAGVTTVANCLMPNHFHWAIATGEVPFDKPFHDAMTRHAVRFNRLYGRTGHLFESRHWSFHCEDARHIMDVVAYIHLNPDRAKLVRHPSDWDWSTFNEWSSPQTGMVDFARISKISGVSVEELRSRHAERIRTELSGGAKGLPLDVMIKDIAAMLGISAERLVAGAKGDVYTLAKRKLIDRCAEENISVADLAKALGCTREAIYMAKKRHI